jgi:hypothetical protein
MKKSIQQVLLIVFLSQFFAMVVVPIVCPAATLSHAADRNRPTVTAFTIPFIATSLTVPITKFTATDDVGVTSYLVKASSTNPSPSDSGWTATAPTSYTFSSAGIKTLYAWAKDAAGNVSARKSATVFITRDATPPSDTTPPTVTAFTIPATATSLTVPITKFTATDDVGVTGYLVKASSTNPSPSDSGWTATAPTSYTFSSAGAKTLYGWAKDAAGNISARRSATVTITLDAVPPTVSISAPASGATVLGTVAVSAAASDNVGVAGVQFLLDGSPLGAEDYTNPYSISWDTTAVGNGAHILSARARDEAGNRTTSAGVTVTVANTTPTGEPILVISTSSNPFSSYYSEILRTEGFNAFSVADIASVTSSKLSKYDAAILGEMTLTQAQVDMLTAWVNSGGNLIAMRPDKKLSELLGLKDGGSTLSDSYLLVDSSSDPGAGIVAETIQYHGAADIYSLNGASSIATLYSNSDTATPHPAVTLRSVGAGGGQAAAFTYDLARSVVYTRQGNPDWAGQDRDGLPPCRSNDLFWGNASWDLQPNWNDWDKVSIPQADEQQRLLANLIIQMNYDKKPLPRFWYFPRGVEAVVIMTGDDHGAPGGTAGRFQKYVALSPSGCSVANWECVRSSSYTFPATPLTDKEAGYYASLGFEPALHVNTGCADWDDSASLNDLYDDQLASWTAIYPSAPTPATNRAHCIAWSDYTTQAEVELAHGIRLDTSYYYWPPEWAANRPGFFTGSGMPMRFATAAGNTIDVYQAATQMTDESGQKYPFTVDTLLDRAIGRQGYYGAFTINMHTDVAESGDSDAIVASAQARGIPIVSSRQMLEWLDGRNGSSFRSFAWDGSSLRFTIDAAAGANGLRAMVPIPEGETVGGVLYNGAPINYTTEVIKGVHYAVFSAGAGAYQVSYAYDATPPTVVTVTPSNAAVDVRTAESVKAMFSESIDPATIHTGAMELRNPADELIEATVSYDNNTKTATLDPIASLAASTTYWATVLGGANGVKDAAGNPLKADFTWSFTTAASDCPCSIWDNSAVFSYVAANDPNPVELGVKFRSETDGYITGIRFYKGSQNTGVHVGNLWTKDRVRLATVNFNNETTSGWQEVSFSSPVPIQANTTYVASYHTSTGYYSGTYDYFSGRSYSNGPLRALSDGEDGSNGVFSYGPGQFPDQSYRSSNYWVDVVFIDAMP